MIGTKSRGLIGELKRARESLIRDHLSGMPGAVFVKRNSDWVEGVIRRLFSESAARNPGWAQVELIALGGFGRGELNLHSDVDLMFLYPPRSKTEIESLAQQILYPLWDLGLDVGHSTRTIDDCLDMAKQDFSVLVSMLTARTLAGSGQLGEKLMTALARTLKSTKARRDFFRRVQEGDEARQHRYGHTPYLLEPHLKEGEGGLRDIHAITWVGLGCYGVGSLSGLVGEGLLSDDEVASIGEARDFIWRVRNHLHYLAGSHDDRLTFEAQDKVASFLGYKTDEGLSRAQRFMQAYYSRAFGLRNIRELFFERAGLNLLPDRNGRDSRVVDDHLVSRDGKLFFAEPAGLDDRPQVMMALFAVAARTGIKVSRQARSEVSRRLYLVDDDFRRDEAVRGLFYQVLMPEHRRVYALAAMHDAGLLMAYLPELAGVFQLPQDDVYHLYTVDIHLLRTVDILNRLPGDERINEPLAARLVGQLSRPRLLYLAALLHDLGKSEGQGHSRRGAEMVGPVLDRLGLTEEQAGVVRFLIAHHLYLADVSARRDLHDEKTLFEAARLIGDDERLAMLYLLTIADGLATGPEAWSSWKSTLVKEFYVRVSAMFSRKDIDYFGSPEWLEELRRTVVGLLDGRVDPEEAERRLDNMSDQYLLATAPEVIADHIHLLTGLRSGRRLSLTVDQRPAEGFCQLTLATRRRRGLFGRMAGVLTLNGLNILGAQIYHTVDKASIVVFQVAHPADSYGLEAKWVKVEEDMLRAVTGRLALAVRLAQRLGQMSRTERPTARQTPKVNVDNGVSDFQTVVEVTTYDRLGLLYDITEVLYELDLEIHLAKISTKADQVVDVFYVADRDGGQVEDEEQLTEMKEALIAIL